jgi:hypothetical protein
VVAVELIPLPAKVEPPPDVTVVVVAPPTTVVVVVAVPVTVVVVVVCPGRLVVVTEVVVMVVVVDSDVTVAVTVLEAVAEFSVDDSVEVELALGAEEPVLESETAVDHEDSDPAIVEVVVAEGAAWKMEEPTSPQPATREVAAATSSRLANATLNLFKLATEGRKPRFHHKYFCPNARTKLHHSGVP